MNSTGMGQDCRLAELTNTPMNEIEITPEMIEAGISVLRASSPRFDLDETIVCCIFAAMASACEALETRVGTHDWGVIEGIN